MERIVLEVDDTAGEMYRGFSDQIKQQFNQTISSMIKKVVDDKDIDILPFLSDLRKEMAENGLTQEILDDILRNEA